MIRLNNAPVIELSLHLPLNGAWTAEMHCSATEAFAVGSIATLSMPENDFVGRIVRCQLYSERVHVRMSGGTIDWQAAVLGLNYTKVEADKVLSDVGVSTEVSLSTQLPFWTRTEGTIGQTVQMLARHLGFNWRVNPDGVVRLAAENPVIVDADSIETFRDEARGMIELAVEKATVLPGCLVGADVVGDVIYLVQDSGIKCRYWTEGRGRALERYIRWATRDQLYLGQYTAKVAKTSSDGLLDLIPEDPRLRGTGLQGVPLLHGLPGCTVTVPADERVLLSFENGNPSKPVASLWFPGNVTSVQIGGAIKVALATLVKAELDKIQSAFDTHTHLYSPGPSAPAPTGPPAALIGPISEVASQKLSTL